MSVTAKDVLKIMESWVGKSRSAGTHRDIIDLYNGYLPRARNYKVTYKDAYCDTTVSAVFIKLGAVDKIGGTECGVQNHIEKFKAAGIWYEDGTIVPEVGDIVCFNWDDGTQPNDGYADHIGFVYSVDKAKRTMTFVEGNMSGGIVGYRRNIPVGWGYIRGYARPKYDKDTVVKPVETPVTKPSTTTSPLNKTEEWKGVVTASSLSVRIYAGTENKECSFSPFKKGEVISVCDSVKAKDGDTWYYICSNGKYGFVHSDYVEKDTETKVETADASVGTVTASVLNVRTWAGTEYGNIKSYPTLKRGDKVRVLSSLFAADGSRWYKICINNSVTKNKDIVGFVAADYINK